MALTKLTTDLIDGTIVTSVNGSTGAVTLETGTDWQATPKTADFTAVAGEGYFVDTTSAAITVTLPSSPSTGDEVNLVDYAGTANTNNITITSSDNINGASNDVIIDYERGGVSIVYVDATQGWIAYNAANETATALIDDPPSVDVDYLLVAGGASGGSGWGGGGGAGGLLEDTITSIPFNETLTISIGGGGAGVNTQSIGNNGTNSTITSSAITNITAIGGGAGGSNVGSPYSGQPGGSGGGGSENTNYLTGGAGEAGPPRQGYNGGNGFSGGVTTASGGGGGGAGAAGSNGVSADGGDGGIGATTTIISTTNATNSSVGEVSGSNVYFAGGGGGGGNGSSIGGLGGGADFSGTGGGTNAAGNTGGGGSSSYQYPPYNGNSYTGSGGSGVCILRMPTASYSGTTTGSPDVYTEGSNTVLVYRTGGTYTT